MLVDLVAGAESQEAAVEGREGPGGVEEAAEALLRAPEGRAEVAEDELVRVEQDHGLVLHERPRRELEVLSPRAAVLSLVSPGLHAFVQLHEQGAGTKGLGSGDDTHRSRMKLGKQAKGVM